MIQPSLFHLERGPSAWIVELQAPVGSLQNQIALADWKKLLLQIASGSVPRIIVDFHQVAYFGSALLEMLLALHSELQSHGGTLVLCNLSPVGHEILEVARFNTLWTIYPSRTAALEAAAGPADA